MRRLFCFLSGIMTTHIFTYLVSLLLALSLVSCASRKPVGDFSTDRIPVAPQYSDSAMWAALPSTTDPADVVPSDALKNRQETAPIDVFFIHPTTYTRKRGNDQWNGPIDDSILNQRTDTGTIFYQASIFNGVGKVYAPRYRQAHLRSYFLFKKNPKSALQAFELAYQDVATAFRYYLEHKNKGRPIIIAAHSQGTTHGIRLIKEFFDGKPLQNKLVAAYLVGMPVKKDTFQNIPLCTMPNQTGCFCSWRTVRRGKQIDWDAGEDIAVTNPLTWETTPTYVPKQKNKGAVLKDFYEVLPEATDAQVTPDGFLWATRPKFPWSWLFQTNNYHIVDYNLYYMNVRANAQLRAQTYLQSQ